eukprot:1084086-Prymnesium_polylepis.1
MAERAAALTQAAAQWELRLEGDGAARRDRPSCIALVRPTTRIGRGDPTQVDVRLDSAALPGLLSRLHARIEIQEDGAPMLHDCSMNAVRVDGRLVSRASAPLAEGTVVIFGAKARGAEAEFKYVVRRRTTTTTSNPTPRTDVAKRQKLEGASS